MPWDRVRTVMLVVLSALAWAVRSEAQAPSVGAPSVDAPSLDVSSLDMSGQTSMQDLYLEVIDGDRPTGRIVHARLRDGKLLVEADQLRALGILLPPGASIDGDGLVSLDALPNLTYRYERFSQRLFLQTSPAHRPTSYLGYVQPAAVDVRRDWGLLFSYDTYGRGIADSQSFSMTNTLRWFGPFGALESTGLGRAGTDARTRYHRLDTHWTYSDPRRLWTWTAGDLISSALSWTRPVRLAGVQWRRNFGVRPDLITLPLPQFSGHATLPSSIELYVNNVRQFRADVPPGPFVLDALPRIRGAGEATMLVTDALGRVTETTLPIFVDHQRLARGLTDFGVEAGFRRVGYGGVDDTYERRPAGSASIRHGLFDTFTIEGHGEAGDDIQAAGVGGVWTPADRWGLLAASYARSNGGGERWSLGYQWSYRGYGFDLQRVRQNTSYRDLASPDVLTRFFLPPLQRQDRAIVWLPIPRGSVSFSYFGWREDDHVRQWTRSVSWSQTLGRRLSVSASIFDDRVSGTGGGLTITVPLDRQLYATAGVRHGSGGTTTSIGARRPAPYGGGWGWTARAARGPGAWSLASAEVRGRVGEATLGIDRIGDRTGAFVQAAGSLAVMDGHVFPSRRITDAFAVVSTNGVSGVPVLYENRVYGSTGASGHLLVPELRGWQRNRLAIDPDNLAVSTRVGDLQQTATPPDRGGAFVRFEVAEIHPAIVTLLGPDGQPVPAGSRGQIVGTGGAVIVGFDGEAWLEDVSTAIAIEVEVGAVRCRYRVPAVAAVRHVQTPVTRVTLACEVIRP